MPDIDDPFLEEVEPTAAQVGIDVPGSRSGFTDFINFGTYNGNFRVGPPDPSANIDVVGAAGSNFVPGWRFVQSSNTTVTAKIRSIGAASLGSNIRFTFGPGVNAGHEAYIEQIVDIGGSGVGDVGGFIRLSGLTSRETISSGLIVVKMQYLASDGSITGMPAEISTNWPFSSLALRKMANINAWALDYIADINPPPPSVRYSRYRIVVQADINTVNGDYVDIYDVRRERAVTGLRMTDRGRAGINSFSDIVQSGSNLLWQPASTTGGTTTATRLLNYQLIPLTYSLVNIPANAVTNMQLWGDTALALGTPRIGLPWGSSIVGASYRLSAVPTAGGASALSIRVQVGGSTVWTPFTIAGSGGALSSEASQAVGTDDVASGGQIGVVVDTSSTYAPTSADIAVIVWVAVKYDGA